MIYAAVLIAVVLTLCLVTLIKTRTVKTQTDFLVAGRMLPWPVLVFTLLSSWIGAGSLFAGGENAYRNGFAALWQPAGGWLGIVVVALIAGRARRLARFTIPELLEARYNAAARVMGTVAIVISYTVITSYQFKAGGDILKLIFPSVSRDQGMCVIAAFVIVFTARAGMASIAYLDVVIGALVAAIIVVAVPILLHRAGGWTHVVRALPATHFEVLGNLSLAQALNYTIPTMLLLVGNQSMYQKVFAARSERDAKWAVFGWITGTLFLETLLVTVAVIGSSLFRTDRPREIIPITAVQGLPSIVGALLLGGIFAKVISTANNYLFSPATNLIYDVYGRFIDPRASEHRKLVMSRWIVLFLGLFALLQATRFESILNAAIYAYTVYGAAVTPAVLAAFFWKRVTTAAAITSIALGSGITVALNLAGYELAIYPALGASLISLIVVSYLSQAPLPAQWKPFFEN